MRSYAPRWPEWSKFTFNVFNKALKFRKLGSKGDFEQSISCEIYEKNYSIWQYIFFIKICAIAIDGNLFLGPQKQNVGFLVGRGEGQ